MSTAKTILGIVPGLQATSILSMNIPKNLSMKPSKNMKIKPVKHLVKTGVGTMIGIGMIGATAGMINSMD